MTVESVAAASLALALLISAWASSSVDIYARQVVVQGLPSDRRRSPSFVCSRWPRPIGLLAAGAEPPCPPALSQVRLWIGVPVRALALLPVYLTPGPDGPLGHPRPVTIDLSWLIAGLMVTRNLVLWPRPSACDDTPRYLALRSTAFRLLLELGDGPLDGTPQGPAHQWRWDRDEPSFERLVGLQQRVRSLRC